MPDKKPLTVTWTTLASEKSIEIKKYIRENFSEREVETYLELLQSFASAISIFPTLYPETSKNKKNKAFSSKQISFCISYYKRQN